MNQTDPLKVGVVFIGRRRPGFDMDWGRGHQQRAREWFNKSGFAIFEPGEKAVDDASMRSSMVACEAQKVDVIAVLQTTMGDARLAPTLAQDFGPIRLFFGRLPRMLRAT